MTVAEIASILKLNRQTVRNWIDAGKLPALHIGRRVRIRRADFDALLEASAVGASSGPTSTPPSTSTIWNGQIPPPVMPANER